MDRLPRSHHRAAGRAGVVSRGRFKKTVAKAPSRHIVGPAYPAWEPGSCIDEIIEQFCDQFAFVRELITNSIDAGSDRVAVDFGFKEPDLAEIRVEDWGSGMTREQIDSRLTSIFRSQPIDMGHRLRQRLGFGFVSVFALHPVQVVVETGTNGRSWRVIFRPRKAERGLEVDYEVIASEELRQGTRVVCSFRLSPPEWTNYQREARLIACRWCKHARADIQVDGESINEEFAFPHPLAVNIDQPDLRLTVCPSYEERPFFGCYRRGIALMEGYSKPVPGVSFKLDSPELTALLTRDGVVENEVYHTCMKRLQTTVTSQLVPLLLATEGDMALGYLAHHEARVKARLPLLAGGTIGVRGLRWAARLWGGIYWDCALTPEVNALVARGIPVLAGLEQGLQALLQTCLPGAPVLQATLEPPPTTRGWLEWFYRQRFTRKC